MTARTIPANRTRNAGRLALDLGMFAAGLLLMEPRATGLAIHEWLGIAIAFPIVTHLLLNWQWVVTVTKKMFSTLPTATRTNQVLNTILFVSMVVAIQSGVMISEVALPGVADLLGGSNAWRGLHAVSTTTVALGVAAHAAMHWRWIARTAGRLLGIETAPARASRPAPATATVGGR
jgi:hypothetical protein